MNGSGDFSIGSQVWPGTSKLIEEMGELQQVLGKLIATHGYTEHWSGDLRTMLINEIADVLAAVAFFTESNLSENEALKVTARANQKIELFRKWHSEQPASAMTLESIARANKKPEADVGDEQ
jgi:hypothetical protein